MVKSHLSLLLSISLFLMSSCATLPTDFERQQSYGLPDTEESFLGKTFLDDKAAHPGQSGFNLLGNGLDAFVARAVLAQVAERSIDVQYYLYHDDLVGRLFSYQLIRAADRGIRVRILVDDMDLAGRDLSAAVMDSHPNIEVRLFNPFSRNTSRASQLITRMGSVTRRMHNKSFTADNQVTILGGRNIGNEYFDAEPDMAFADLDVMAVGDVVHEVSRTFDLYWNSELAYPVSVLVKKIPTQEQLDKKSQQFNAYIAEQINSSYMQALLNSDLAGKMHEDRLTFEWGDAHLVYDKPEKILHDYEHEDYMMALELKPYLDDIREELIVISPYFIPGKQGTDLLVHLADKGVRVRILTNSLASSDVSIVHAGYSKYRKALLRGGVELYEMNKKLSSKERKEKKESSSQVSLHAKSFIYDRKNVFIGSLNLDARSLVHNTEIGVVISSEPVADGMGQWFDENIDKVAFQLELLENSRGKETLVWHGWVEGQRQTLKKEPYTGFWKRLSIGFMSILPIESQL